MSIKTIKHIEARDLKEGDVILGVDGTSRLTVIAALTPVGDNSRIETKEFGIIRFEGTRTLKVERVTEIPVGTVKNFRGSAAIKTDVGWIVVFKIGHFQGSTSTRQDDEFWDKYPTVEFPENSIAL